MKKTLALLLAVVMVLAVLAGCGPQGNTESTGGSESTNPPEGTGSSESTTPEDPGTYTYNTSISIFPSNWNPHTYTTADDGMPLDYTRSALYSFIFNDADHPVEGKDPYTGYVIVPEMAAEMAVDVTEEVKASHPQFNIPESATSGYAWKVVLRDDLKWEDGTPITAQTFVDSLERVLRPELLNYRAYDNYSGQYAVVNAMNYALSGQGVFTSFASMGTTYEDYIAEGHTDDEVYVDMNGFWGVTAADKHTYAKITDDNMVRDPAVPEGENEDYVSAKYLFDNYLGPNGDYAGSGYDTKYLGILECPYEAGYSFDNVGLYAESDTELVYVYGAALDGFYLYYGGLSNNFLVKPDLYDSCLQEVETPAGTVWSSTYGTSIDTYSSYGPYKISAFQTDKNMHFVKNENWYGWTDGNHVFVDPEDGQTYNMYQTTDIDFQYVKEPATAKQMFLAGQLMTYGLQAEDYDQYRNSEYYYVTPSETVFGMIFNGYESVISSRENSADFDKTTTDLQTQMLQSFRRACAVSIDRDLFCATVRPAYSAGYGFLGQTFIVDPDTCEYYRDTDAAKMALIDFYSVNLDDYNGDLDAAVGSITGYDPETAAELFQQAYEEALAAGYVTDEDGDGKSDQTVTMIYAMGSDMSTFMEKTLKFLNDSLNAGAAGTGFEGKILIDPSANVGNDWEKNIKNGTMDTELCGWSGSPLDPYSVPQSCWTSDTLSYWNKWWDPKTNELTINVDGADITMSYTDWAECLNGVMKTVDGVEYNFGFNQAEKDTRIDILAALEHGIMTQYHLVPLMQESSGFLLTQKAYYVVEEYNPIMSRGGISYMRYNYTDAEWDEYVASQGGTLQY